MPKYACRKCGKTDQISVLVEVPGWEGIDGIRPNEDNPARLTYDETGEREAEWRDKARTGYHCGGCDSESGSLEELVEAVPEEGPAPERECRECGWAGDSLEEHAKGCGAVPEVIAPPEVSEEQEKLDIPV
jgi:hypothetical protein